MTKTDIPVLYTYVIGVLVHPVLHIPPALAESLVTLLQCVSVIRSEQLGYAGCYWTPSPGSILQVREVCLTLCTKNL